MNCNKKIANALIFKELALLALSVVIIEGEYADATDVTILGVADGLTLGVEEVSAFGRTAADTFIVVEVSAVGLEDVSTLGVEETSTLVEETSAVSLEDDSILGVEDVTTVGLADALVTSETYEDSLELVK